MKTYWLLVPLLVFGMKVALGDNGYEDLPINGGGGGGATGQTGKTGATGSTGSSGATGQTGSAGAIGQTGASGASGLTGATGQTGSAGAIGASGQTGLTGQTGQTGPSGVMGLTGPVVMWVGASNVTDTTGSLVSVTNMSFAIAVNETWAFTFWIQSQCNNTGGIDYGINGPTSATIRALAQGASTGVTARTSAVISALNTATSASFNTANTAGGWVQIYGTITADATHAGTVQLQFDAHTATQTATIFGNSWGIAVRVN